MLVCGYLCGNLADSLGGGGFLCRQDILRGLRLEGRVLLLLEQFLFIHAIMMCILTRYELAFYFLDLSLV